MDNQNDTWSSRPETMNSKPLILLTGATGYVGGRLLTQLEMAGQQVRCLTRRPETLQPRVAAEPRSWLPTCWIPASLPGAMEGGNRLLPCP